VRMEFKGIQPMGRALAHGEFIVGRKEWSIDIEEAAAPNAATASFAFVNNDPLRLLWRHCYNN